MTIPPQTANIGIAAPLGRFPGADGLEGMKNV
jgi:hypothetical protein